MCVRAGRSRRQFVINQQTFAKSVPEEKLPLLDLRLPKEEDKKAPSCEQRPDETLQPLSMWIRRGGCVTYLWYSDTKDF